MRWPISLRMPVTTSPPSRSEGGARTGSAQPRVVRQDGCRTGRGLDGGSRLHARHIRFRWRAVRAIASLPYQVQAAQRSLRQRQRGRSSHRECMALGTGTVSCDMSVIPLLPDLEPETALLTWTIDLNTTSTEDAIREVSNSWTAIAISPSNGRCPVSRMRQPAKSTRPRSWLCSPASRAKRRCTSSRPSRKLRLSHPGGPVQAAPVQRSVPRRPRRPQLPPPLRPARKPPARAPPARHPDDPRRSRARRPPHRSRRRAGHPPGDAVAARPAVESRRASEISVGLEELEQLTREIQDSVMAIRAQR